MERSGNSEATSSLSIKLIAGTIGTTVVTVAGELDVATGPQLRAFVSETLTQPEHQVVDLVLDLRALSFLDSIGLGVIARVFREARAAGASLQVRCIAGPVSRLMDSTGLSSVIETFVSAASEASTPSSA